MPTQEADFQKLSWIWHLKIYHILKDVDGVVAAAALSNVVDSLDVVVVSNVNVTVVVTVVSAFVVNVVMLLLLLFLCFYS